MTDLMVSGTRNPTQAQLVWMRHFLRGHTFAYIRHGGCRGIDAEAHRFLLAYRPACAICSPSRVGPSKKHDLRAWPHAMRLSLYPADSSVAARDREITAGAEGVDELHVAAPPLKRNQEMVDDMVRLGHRGPLLALPGSAARSGTRDAMGRARSARLVVITVEPHGEVSVT